MARKNRGLEVGPNVTLDRTRMQSGTEKFGDWHWGVGPSKVTDWGDKDYPPMLIECGRLVRLQFRAPQGARPNRHPRRRRDTMIEFALSLSNNSHIAYDPEHPDERLYLLVDPRASATLAKRFWTNNSMAPISLNDLAATAGGRHGKRRDYPSIQVKPIGILTAVVYYTHKRGDENPSDPHSYYIHQVGEVSKHMPILSADSRGRLWLAGGNYTSPSPGITD